jgi:hypothetical protein
VKFSVLAMFASAVYLSVAFPSMAKGEKGGKANDLAR